MSEGHGIDNRGHGFNDDWGFGSCEEKMSIGHQRRESTANGAVNKTVHSDEAKD